MSGLFSRPKIPPPPPEKPPAPMPDMEAPEVRRAGRDEMMRRRRGSGRESTMLSGQSGGDYSRTNLGM